VGCCSWGEIARYNHLRNPLLQRVDSLCLRQRIIGVDLGRDRSHLLEGLLLESGELLLVLPQCSLVCPGEGAIALDEGGDPLGSGTLWPLVFSVEECDVPQRMLIAIIGGSEQSLPVGHHVYLDPEPCPMQLHKELTWASGGVESLALGCSSNSSVFNVNLSVPFPLCILIIIDLPIHVILQVSTGILLVSGMSRGLDEEDAWGVVGPMVGICSVGGAMFSMKMSRW